MSVIGFHLVRGCGQKDESFLTLFELARRVHAIRGQAAIVLRPANVARGGAAPEGLCVAVRFEDENRRPDLIGYAFVPERIRVAGDDHGLRALSSALLTVSERQLERREVIDLRAKRPDAEPAAEAQAWPDEAPALEEGAQAPKGRRRA